MDDPMISMVAQGEISGVNLYSYCNNNPVMNIDQSGFAAIRMYNLQGTYKGRTACIYAILSLILTTGLVTYAFFSFGKSLISIGVAGQIFSFNLSSAVTIPMIIVGFLMCTGSIIYATYMAAMIIKAIHYTVKYNKFKIKKAWGFSIFTYKVKKA